jgi:hypothetical protein
MTTTFLLRVKMGRCAVAAVVLLVSGLATARAQQSAASSYRVWTLHGECSTPAHVALDFRQHGTLLRRYILSMCHSTVHLEHVLPDSSFTLRFTTAVRRAYGLKPSESVSADIWEAGADSDAVVLGISLETDRVILVNTLHMLRADRLTWQTLGGGLTVRSYPVSARKSSNDR